MVKQNSKSMAAGGFARAKALSAEDRAEIAKKAAAARWDKTKNIPQAVYTGMLTLGDMSFPCSL